MENTFINDELIVRYFSGNSSEEDRRILLSWISESHENEEQLFLMKDIYDAGIGSQLYEEAKTGDGWHKLQKAIAQIRQLKAAPSRRIMRPHWTEQIRKYAAILVIGVLGGIVLDHFYLSPNKNEPTASIDGKYEIITGRGERVMVTLPDGTTVKLNSCSYLSYTADFGKSTRQLQFSGEAFFDVQTNPNMPFVVQTAGLNIKALGTEFNIKAYLDDDIVETTLVEGMLTIENEHHQNIVTLKPNQVVTIPKNLITTAAKTSINKEEQAISTISSNNDMDSKIEKIAPKVVEQQKAVLKNIIEPDVYTSWKDDRWVIRSESLEELAKKMERKYDVTFTFEDDESKKYIFSGTLKNFSLEQILEVIKFNAPIKYVVKEKSVTIREDKNLKKKFKKLIYSPD